MTEEKKTESGAISRREFLKDAGLLVGGTAIGSTVLLAACGGETETVTKTNTSTVTAPGGTATVTTTAPGETQTITVTKTVEIPAEAAENAIKLTVNGKEYEVQVEPNMTLQDMLREKLGFTSPKDMCFGQGACGSCTVIMDGRPILSCMVLAVECKRAVIETSEGIADANHPLIESFIRNYVAQCGYCIPGFVCTAKALLDHNSNPTEEDIREALAGNICRCACYDSLVPAVLEAAEGL